MTEKEFEINDILNAVNSISKIEKKKTKIVEKKDSANKDDLNPMLKLLKVLEKPYQKKETKNNYQAPGPITDERYQTFCGT